jgi:antitoxin component YwqK of YwqJK toxin-antitoxin module
MWKQLPVEIIRLILEYDPTYWKLYSQIVRKRFQYVDVGPYRLNVHTGHRQFYNEKGELEWESTFFQGYYEGPERSYFHQQLRTEKYYQKSQLHGPLREYNKHGQLLVEKYFVRGLQEGFMNHYFENGNLFQKCFFQRGKRHGPFLQFGKDGGLREVRVYKKGKIYGNPNKVCIKK